MSFLNSLFGIFLSTLVPVILVAGAGYLLATYVKMDSRTLGRFLFFLASPALVFRSLYKMTLDMTALSHVLLIAFGVMVVGIGLGFLAGYDQDRRHKAALILSSTLGNNGNMGISICLFAFGEAGVALATLYYAASSLASNTVGVVVASAGSTPLSRALGQSLRAPVLYAAVLGLALNRLQLQAPEPIFNAIDLLAGAAVPGMLVLLGIQLRSTKFDRTQRVVWRIVLIQLVASPLAAWVLCTALGVTGLERQVLLVQSGMPTAVATTVLATEYDAAPHLVAAAVLATTLGSIFTLSLILGLVRL